MPSAHSASGAAAPDATAAAPASGGAATPEKRRPPALAFWQNRTRKLSGPSADSNAPSSSSSEAPPPVPRLRSVNSVRASSVRQTPSTSASPPKASAPLHGSPVFGLDQEVAEEDRRIAASLSATADDARLPESEAAGPAMQSSHAVPDLSAAVSRSSSRSSATSRGQLRGTSDAPTAESDATPRHVQADVDASASRQDATLHREGASTESAVPTGARSETESPSVVPERGSPAGWRESMRAEKGLVDASSASSSQMDSDAAPGPSTVASSSQSSELPATRADSDETAGVGSASEPLSSGEGEGDAEVSPEDAGSPADALVRDAARARRRRRLLREQVRKRQSKRQSTDAQGQHDAEEELSREESEEGSDSSDDQTWASSSKDADPGSPLPGRLRRARRLSPSTATHSASSAPDGRSVTPGAVSSSDSFYDAAVSPESGSSSPERLVSMLSLDDAPEDGLDEQDPGRRRLSQDDGLPNWLRVSPRPSEMASSATLRQDALDSQRPREFSSARARDSSSPARTPSTARTPSAEWGPGMYQSPDSSISSVPTLDSPLPSPTSPNASFMPSLTSPSASRMFVKPSDGYHRVGRYSALPPPRPTPSMPPPPPPKDLPESRVSAAAERGRARSQSLSQAALDMDALDGRDAGYAARSISQTPGLRSRDGGISLQPPSGRPAISRRSSSSSGSGAPLPPTKEEEAPPQTPPKLKASSLGPNGTICGRPRGATVGAVPAASSSSPSGRFSVQTRARPRSMLCNEMVVPGLESLARSDEDHDGSENPSALLDVTAPGSSSTPAGSSPIDNSGQSDATRTSSATTAPSLTGSMADKSRAVAGSGDGELSARQNQQLRRSVALAVGGPSAYIADSERSTSSSSTPATSTGAALSATGGTGTSSAPGGAATPAGSASAGARSRSGSTASLRQQVQHPPKSHASFVIAVVGHQGAGKTTVIKKGLRQFGLSKPNVLSEKIASHSTICIVDQEQRTIEVLEIDASVLLNGPSKRFAWPKFLPHIDAIILCYDAAQISSFRGMSELLENFAMHSLSTVMLACKSESFPKAVDPYYASDMAAVYNVGLAECSDQSEEGKKRMRDCFSYLVKEVAKARAGRKPAFDPASHQLQQLHGTSSAAGPGSSSRKMSDATSASLESARTSSVSQQNSPALSSGGYSSSNENPGFALAAQSGGHDVRNTARKLSDATTMSVDAPSLTGSNSEDEAALQQSISKAQLGLQSAKTAGGYVSIEELWEKLFFAAVSGDDERFLLMFMVFYRGFARPIDLLRQLVARFDALSSSERSDGVMIRFSLMRLTAMLGDWMQDYPGDLSAPETYSELCDFFQRLLRHPSTMHIASPLQPHLEALRFAPDPDAAWSRNQDNDKPRSVAADVPPVRPSLLGVDGQTLAQSSTSATASGFPSGSYSTENSSQEVLRSRAYSDSSAASGSAIESAQPSRPSLEHREHSYSDVQTSSDSGVKSAAASISSAPHAHSSGASGGYSAQQSASDTALASQPANVNAAVSAPAPAEGLTNARKTALRSISNALADTDEEVIAAELTRIEWNLFCAIRPRDLLRHILASRELREKNGSVARSIAHFNYISAWVCTMILIQGKIKHRARMLEKFMSIAAILRHSNNYNTLHAVLAGLGNASVHRLKHTRELLNGKAVNKVYLSLARLMGSDRSFAAYRLALENSEGRTIPYLGVHLQDILSLSDGNPSKRASDDMVHWRKFSLMDEAVMAIVRCQQHERGMARANASVERLIVDLPLLDEEEMYQRSLQVEPRAQTGPAALTSSKIKGFFA